MSKAITKHYVTLNGRDYTVKVYHDFYKDEGRDMIEIWTEWEVPLLADRGLALRRTTWRGCCVSNHGKLGKKILSMIENQQDGLKG